VRVLTDGDADVDGGAGSGGFLGEASGRRGPSRQAVRFTYARHGDVKRVYSSCSSVPAPLHKEHLFHHWSEPLAWQAGHVTVPPSMYPLPLQVLHSVLK
jgi:hypothetical protein